VEDRGSRKGGVKFGGGRRNEPRIEFRQRYGPAETRPGLDVPGFRDHRGRRRDRITRARRPRAGPGEVGIRRRLPVKVTLSPADDQGVEEACERVLPRPVADVSKATGLDLRGRNEAAHQKREKRHGRTRDRSPREETSHHASRPGKDRLKKENRPADVNPDSGGFD
jgi:hypothetical protein